MAPQLSNAGWNPFRAKGRAGRRDEEDRALEGSHHPQGNTTEEAGESSGGQIIYAPQPTRTQQPFQSQQSASEEAAAVVGSEQHQQQQLQPADRLAFTLPALDFGSNNGRLDVPHLVPTPTPSATPQSWLMRKLSVRSSTRKTPKPEKQSRNLIARKPVAAASAGYQQQPIELVQEQPSSQLNLQGQFPVPSAQHQPGPSQPAQQVYQTQAPLQQAQYQPGPEQQQAQPYQPVLQPMDENVALVSSHHHQQMPMHNMAAGNGGYAQQDPNGHAFAVNGMNGGHAAIPMQQYAAATAMEKSLDPSAAGGLNGGQVVVDESGKMEQNAEIPAWKWKVVIVVCTFLTMMNGYDVSNTANIQSPLYEAFGHIEVLAWVGIGYAGGVFATAPIWRRIAFIFDLKITLVVASLIFLIGVIISATANSLNAVIVGRFINGVGGAGGQMLIFTYTTLLPGPMVPKVTSLYGMFWAIGLMCGPLIGGGFADNQHATWRWAFYLVLIVYAACLLPVALLFPSYTVRNVKERPLLNELKHFDWIGAVLHPAATITLFAAITFPGPVFAWNSGSAIALWVVTCILWIVYGVQQWLCILTTPDHRVFAVNMLSHRVVALCAVSTICAGIAYGPGLYYLPLYYAFTKGLGPIDSAVRLLPYIGTFIGVVIIAGIMLPKVRFYSIFYLISGPLILIGGSLLATQVAPDTSISRVMGFSTLIGGGIGLVFQHGLAVSSAALPVELKWEASAMHSMAQTLGVSLGLSLAGCIFQNKGFELLRDAIKDFGFSDQDIREALGGVKSPILEGGNPEAALLAVNALVEGITRVFYLIVAAGVISTIAALCMKWERLDFNTPGHNEQAREASPSIARDSLEMAEEGEATA